MLSLDAISTSNLIDIKDSANNEGTSSCAANELGKASLDGTACDAYHVFVTDT